MQPTAFSIATVGLGHTTGMPGSIGSTDACHVGMAEDPTNSFNEFETAGMPECIGGTDVCHIGMPNCPHALQPQNSGFKLSMSTQTFNLTANHRQCALHTTTGPPGRWNGKTLVQFDNFATSVRSSCVLQSNAFALLCHNNC